jgi:protocatechuate 3,4-dioxygenase beta subunit
MKILAALLLSTLVLGLVAFFLFGPGPPRARDKAETFRRISGRRISGPEENARPKEPSPPGEGRTPPRGKSAASIAGRVRAPDGRELEGIEVYLFRVEEVDAITLEESGGEGLSSLQKLSESHVQLLRQARSDEAGRFSFEGLAAAVYALEAAGPAFRSTTSNPLALSEDEPRQVDLALEEGLSISGRVLRPDGAPVEGAEIEARLESLSALPRATVDLILLRQASLPCRAKSGDGGRFELEGLLAGSYELTARASDHAPDSLSGVIAGENDLVLVLPQGVLVKGRVVFEDGRPAAGASLSFFPREEERHFPPVPADGEGRFRLGGLPPGLYSLRVAGKGIEEKAMEAFRVRESAENWVAIVVKPGRILGGKVIDPDEKGLAGLDITLVGGSGPERQAVALKTGEDGQFVADTLHAFKYALSVAARPPYDEQLIEPLQPDRQDLVIKMLPGLRVSGRVTAVETGGAIPQARVFIRRLSRDLRGMETRTGSDGRFSLSFPAGEQILLEVRASGYRPHQPFAISTAPQSTVPLEDLEIGLSRAGSLQGVVKTRSGELVEDGRVSFGSEEAGGEIRFSAWGGPVSTQSDGSFRLSLGRTRRGATYRVAVEHPQYYLPEEVSLAVDDPSEDIAGLKIVLERASRVSGTVMSRSRAPVPRASVELLGLPADAPVLEQGPPRAMAFWRSAGSARSRQGGRFELAGLRPGYFILRADAPGFAAYESEPFQIGKGDEATRDILLEEGLGIAGRVLDSQRRPLMGALVAGKGSSREALSDQDGEYRITGLRAGLFDLEAAKDGFGSRVLSRVKAGEEAADIVLEPLGAISGNVADVKTRLPVKSFQLRLLPDAKDLHLQDRLGPQAFQSETGTFLQERIAPGPYRLLVTASGYIASESPIAVEAGGTTRKDVDLDPGEEITGVVLDSREAPVPGAKVLAVPIAQGIPSDVEAPSGASSNPATWTDTAGEFRIAGLEAGAYRIVVRHKSYVPYVSGEVLLSPSTGAPRRETRPETRPGIRAVLGDGARVTGTLRDRKGFPIPQGQVELRGPQLKKTAPVDREGRFIFRGVPSGQYSLGRAGDPGDLKSQAPLEVRSEDTEVIQDLTWDG